MSSTKKFDQLGLPQPILTALTKLGYETPTPVQEQSIPFLISGEDLVAQAQTGTGKTAAFALPILTKIDLSIKKPQALIITPTRELAIQVAEALQSYASQMKGFHVAPIYGGQDYHIQLKALKRGAQVIVGTPGRLMDHMRRETLRVATINTVILDEGDEMLKMGFVEDIEFILQHIPETRQMALFSATMPATIRRISAKYLKNAQQIHIKAKKSNVSSIEQTFIRVAGNQKLDLLTRILEVQDFEAVIIFVRTKNASAELAEKLQARGYAAAALNGDMSQSMREKVIDRLKKDRLDIVIATDVAARGIDVERISLVINYDIPHDSESYIHRIGRTGRAGRTGKAVLFVTSREQRLLNDIHRATGSPIEQQNPPSLQEMSAKRTQVLGDTITRIIEKSSKLGPFYEMLDDVTESNNFSMKDVAAALAYMTQQNKPLPTHEISDRDSSGGEKRRDGRRQRSGGGGRGGPRRRGNSRRAANTSNGRSERSGRKRKDKANSQAGRGGRKK